MVGYSQGQPMKNVQGEASNSQWEEKKASKGKQKTINTRILQGASIER